MTLLIAGLVLFFAVHSVSIVNDPWRERMAARLGEWWWKVIYSALSLAGLAMMVWGYGEARLSPTVIYVPPGWLRHVAMVLLLPVFVLLLAAYLPGRIAGATKHPMLVAVKLWALAHLLVNGTLADLLLFGGFLAWAVADRVSMKRRAQRPLPAAPATAANDAIAVVGGLALYGLFVVWAHGRLIGAPLVW